MATGDSNDILNRVKMLIPFRWFAWIAPIRDAILGGLSDNAAWCYSWIVYARTQSRLATATGLFLDLTAYDFLGRHLFRKNQTDDIYRRMIKATILQERVTRAGMINALKSLTGSAPWIFEPWNTNDAGAWSGPTVAQASHGNFAWNTAGGWGSTDLPAQTFMQVTRASPSGIPNVAGWSSTGHLSGLGGWGVGAIELIGPSQQQYGITNQMIYDMINTTRPTGSIAWTRIN